MIKKYQQGGSSNIAIGSPKPYTSNLPGINIPIGSLNNAPIEINTSSVFDQYEKLQRLKLDNDKLKFQYEELKYKEGKAFMDFAGDMMKTVTSSVQNNLTGLGGFSSMQRYEPIIRRYNENRSNILKKMHDSFTRGDKNGMFNIQKEIIENETNPEYLQALGEIAFLEKTTKYALENPSLTTGELVSKNIDYASGVGKMNFQEFSEQSLPYLGNNLKPKDIQTMFEDYENNLFEYTKGTKTVTGQRVLPSGSLQNTYGFEIPEQERITNDLVRMFSAPGMRQVLETQGINPYNEEQVYNFFHNGYAKTLHESVKKSFPNINENSSTVLKDIEINPDGSVSSKPKPGSGEDGEMSESEKKRQARKDRLVSEFGLNILKDPTVRDFLFSGGDDYFEKIAAYLKGKGIDPKGGAGVSNSKMINIQSLDELGIAFDQSKTKFIKGKDGESYLITNELEVENHIDDTWPESAKRTNLWDRQVREMTGISDEEWDNLPVLDRNAAVYTIEPKSAKGDISSLPDVQPDIVQEMNKNKLIRNMDNVDKIYIAHFLSNEALQDGFFEDELLPEITSQTEYLKRNYPDKTKNFTDNQIGYIIHHQGSEGAEYFFKNNFKTKPSKNTQSSQELTGALSRIGDGDIKEEIAKIESGNNPFIVYKGGQDSSAAGKYQVLAKSRIKQIRDYIDRNTGLIEDEPTEDVQETGEVQPKVTGKFFSALQDSLKANQNFNVGRR